MIVLKNEVIRMKIEDRNESYEVSTANEEAEI
jgi:hypothetical protein